MKKKLNLILFITFLLIAGVKGQISWSQISQQETNLIIVNETTGYYYYNEDVGSHGMKYTLKKSTDGFQSFTTIRTKTGDFGCYGLDEMYFIDSDTGFIAELCQGLTSIYQTVDGGQNWSQTGYGGTYGLSMYFLSGFNGYYSFYPGSGNDSYLMRNGNVVFTTKKYIFTKDNYEYPNYITKIKFINDSTGFVICKDTLENAVILKTSNYGNSWSEKNILSNSLFKDIVFISDSIGFVIGTNGIILNTMDCGENWQPINSNISTSLNSIDFINDSIVYIVGDNGLILKSQNYGLTWSQENFINSSELIYVRSLNNGVVYINDSDGNLYCNNLSSINSANINNGILIYPNPTKDMIHISMPLLSSNFKVDLFNIQGQNLLSTDDNKLNLSNLNAGIYFITIESKQGFYKTKIIKQ